MKKLLSILFFLILFNVSVALPQLIKVTPQNNVKCVEYYTVNNQLMCSMTALNNTSVDPKIKDYETFNIMFDNRPWQAVWGKKTETMTTVEYVPYGQKIGSWNELVTSQFIPNVKITPMEFAIHIINNLIESGFNPQVNIIEVSDDRVIFEFQILSPSNMQQDELQMISKSPHGLNVLHYAIKKPDMGSKVRDEWLNLFRKSHAR